MDATLYAIYSRRLSDVMASITESRRRVEAFPEDPVQIAKIGDEQAVEVLAHMYETRSKIKDLTQHIVDLRDKPHNAAETLLMLEREDKRLEKIAAVAVCFTLSRDLFGTDRHDNQLFTTLHH